MCWSQSLQAKRHHKYPPTKGGTSKINHRPRQAEPQYVRQSTFCTLQTKGSTAPSRLFCPSKPFFSSGGRKEQGASAASTACFLRDLSPINLPLLNNAKVKRNGNCCAAAADTSARRRPAIPRDRAAPFREDRRAIFFVYRFSPGFKRLRCLTTTTPSLSLHTDPFGSVPSAHKRWRRADRGTPRTVTAHPREIVYQPT
ncbi:hypothetical protein GOODEAATRI_016657 [Goodea atripinnis]|uniref:Uncharacterized protein n=1 Tax=Goodea atripinnis TaxID=208336 RepID=A0ABV0PYM3_9TELE